MSKLRHFTMTLPFEIVEVEEPTNGKLKQQFRGQRSGFVQVGPERCLLPKEYQKNALRYYNFQPRPNDVWIMAFPRSGTTMNREIVWLLANKLNYEKASQIPLSRRFPFLEFGCLFHRDVMSQLLKKNRDSHQRLAHLHNLTNALECFEDTTGRRFIKTYLPFHLLHPSLLEVGCKVLYVARNPKDVAVSYYHLQRETLATDFQGDFAKFWDYFENHMVHWSPYWSHILQAWKKRASQNLLFLFYEEQIKDPRRSFKQIAEFLDVSYTEAEYVKLAEYIKIDNFRKKQTSNLSDLRDVGVVKGDGGSLVRKGVNGGSKDYFVGDLESRADKWIQENLKDTDLRFPQFANKI